MAVFSLIGGSGFLGRSLNNVLKLSGHEVRVIERNKFPDVSKNCGNVIYCAGVTRDFKLRSRDIIESHVCYLSTVLRTISCDSFLYLSSARIYENYPTTNEETKIFCDPFGISNFYNLSKLFGESVVMNSSVRAPKVARLSYVVDGISDQFFGPLIGSAKSGVIYLKGHADTEKDFLLLDDASEILTKISLDGNSEIYNVASGCNLSFKKLGSMLENYLKCGVVFEHGWQKRSPAPIEIKKISDKFNFQPRSVVSELEKVFGKITSDD